MAATFRIGSSVLALVLASPVLAQDRAVTYSLYGTPGLLEMPSAISANEGELAGTLGYFGGQVRAGFTFQATERLSLTFRQSGVREYFEEENEDGTTLGDRSFDLRYRFTDEGPLLPMLAVGVQGFLGTGAYSGEYVVATKTIGSSVRATAGLGWGRLGSYNGFSNPLGAIDDRYEVRPIRAEEGASEEEPGVGSLFRGDAAFFGGVEWAPNERWILKAEYSSDDAYVDANGDPLFERRSPFNFGVTWRPRPDVQLGLGYLYGSQLSFGATVTVNPNQRPFSSGLDPAPQPVAIRTEAVRAAQSWDRAALPEAAIRDRLALALRTEGIELRGLQLADRSARVRYTNTRYRSEAQAMGRIVRILTQELPPSIETLVLEPVQRGVPLASATFARTDIETFENEVGGTAATFDRVELEDAGPQAGLVMLPPVTDAFSWSLRPALAYTLRASEQPITLSLSAVASASYRIQPNVILSGSVRQRILPRGDGGGEVEPIGDVPVVRRNAGLYGANGYPTLDRLTLSWLGRPGADLYGRVTLGYLESMYGGVSTELLWKPVESRVGLGAEINYAVQRDYDGLLGFRDYDVVTGHVSAYYDFGNGYHGQVDAGRFLAGDWGATFGLDREFENGWQVGGYFTLTDVPFEDFGEGSFSRGIRVTIPTDFVRGRPSRGANSTTLESVSGDAGARLRVDGRLYEIVRDAHLADLEDSWGRFWR